MDDIKDPIEGGEETPSPVDEVKNLKAEMARKFDNQQSELSKLAQANQQLTEYMRKLMEPKAETESKTSLKEIWYDSPDKAAEIIERRTEERIEKRLREQQEMQGKQSRVLNELIAQYPELSDSNSPLTKKAVEMYGSMNGDTSPAAYKAAVYQAALELDVKPVSKRKRAESDNFSFGGSGPSGESVTAKVSEAIELAKLMGITDPKALERIKAATKAGK
jgi:chromosome segregation ATPase